MWGWPISGLSGPSCGNSCEPTAKVAEAATSESAQWRARRPTAMRRCRSEREAGNSGGGAGAEAELTSAS
eukprot:15479456-Alexandrium_andersonii.AAC.1